MAEAGRAPVPEAAALRITVNANYNCVPNHGQVNNDGDVYFDVAAANGCYIHTSPAQAFEGEDASGYLTLSHGANGPLIPIADNATITYCACAVGGTCDPFTPKENGGNTIGVGNPPDCGTDQ